MQSFWRLRHQEHEAGWVVLLEGERIAELEYLNDDQPWHIFQAKILTPDSNKIECALRNTPKRAASDKVKFRCRAGNVLVDDSDFWIQLYPDGRASIRDLRPGPVLSKPQQFLNEFKSALFSPGRIAFYSSIVVSALVAAVIFSVSDPQPDVFVWIWIICAAVVLVLRAVFHATQKGIGKGPQTPR